MPHLILVAGRMAVYREVSKQIRAIFQRYTDKIEPLSLDEAYLDVTECELLHGSATLIAQDIRRAISEELDLTASAGIAPVKFIAKIASDLNKPDGQYVVIPDDISDFVANLKLEKIPGLVRLRFRSSMKRACTSARMYKDMIVICCCSSSASLASLYGHVRMASITVRLWLSVSENQ